MICVLHKNSINYYQKKVIKISQDFIEYILKQYNLGKLLQEPKKLAGGLTNQSYKIVTKQGAFVVKILNNANKNKLDEIEFTEKINELAYKNGIKSLPAIKLNNTFIQQYEDVHFIIYPYFDGMVILSKEIDLDKCGRLARELAKIHSLDTSKIEIPNTKQIYDDKIDFKFYYDKTKDMDEEWANAFKDKYKIISNIYEKSYDAYKKLSRQKTFTHKDLNRLNVLWKDNDFVIIDWENAAFSNPSIDFFSTAWFLTDDVKEDKYKVFAREYFKTFKFKDSVETAVYAGMVDEIIWLEFNLKRSLGVISKDKEEIKLGKTQIITPMTEIMNYYSKIGKMIEILKNNSCFSHN